MPRLGDKSLISVREASPYLSTGTREVRDILLFAYHRSLIIKATVDQASCRPYHPSYCLHPCSTAQAAALAAYPGLRGYSALRPLVA